MIRGATIIDRPLTNTEIQAIFDEITRREFIVGAAAMSSLLVACGPDETDESGASGSGGSRSFSYKDSRGVTVSLDTMPETIVMSDVSAAALLPYGITPDGVIAAVPPEGNEYLEGIDMSGVESLAEAFGEINMEALAAMQPDLIVMTSFEDYVGYTKNKHQADVLQEIAPVVTVESAGPTSGFLERYEGLAEALGGDLQAPAALQGQEHLDMAIDRLQAAVVANPGVNVLAVRASELGLYVLNAEIGFDLADWESWGVELVRPTGGDEFGQDLSWEQVDRYPADLIVNDGFEGQYGYSQAQLMAQPTFAKLPAAQAGQVIDWTIESSSTADRFATWTDNLAAAIETANANLVT